MCDNHILPYQLEQVYMLGKYLKSYLKFLKNKNFEFYIRTLMSNNSKQSAIAFFAGFFEKCNYKIDNNIFIQTINNKYYYFYDFYNIKTLKCNNIVNKWYKFKFSQIIIDEFLLSSNLIQFFQKSDSSINIDISYIKQFLIFFL